MPQSTIQNSFISGEISPSLFGRTDLKKWQSGASTMRNMFANYRGGSSSRGGTAYIGTCLQPGTAPPPRDIKFQFNINQGYALEFGDQYMRVKSNGAYILESPLAITAISRTNPAVMTYVDPVSTATLVDDDWIYVSSVSGMTNFNGLTWIVYGVVGNTFKVKDLFGVPVDSTTFNAYVSGGTLARVYTNKDSPYAAVDLPYLKFTQSADTMSLTCYNQQTLTEYQPYDLRRLAVDSWSFTPATFSVTIAPPLGLIATAANSTTINTWYSYVVTAVDALTGQESIQSASVDVENNDISINAGTNTISWSSVAGAGYYNIYTATPSYGVQVPLGSTYGFIGSSYSTRFIDTNIIPNFASPPPLHNNPFARGQITSVTVISPGAGYTQGTARAFIQRSGVPISGGFVGTPIVVAGAITAVVVQNGGEGYLPTDTIVISGDGTAASGTYTFSSNPSHNTLVMINGQEAIFGLESDGYFRVPIGANIAGSVANLANALNSASSNFKFFNHTLVTLATYTAVGNVLTITYKSPGTAGNSFTLGTSTGSIARSAPTLTAGAAVTNTSASAEIAVGPQTGTYPGDVAYYQQRRVYANTINEPDTYFMSRPGAYLNMDSSIPTTDSDAIVGTPWAQQINGIQAMVPMTTGLVTLTGNGAWLLNGGSSFAITASDQTATAQAYNGCNPTVPPIVINQQILYVQSKGSIVRDLSYNFYNAIFTGTDITILSNHLFNFHQIIQWAYAEEPYKLAWCVRDDGTMLSLTYLKEQDVYAWARHDTNGFYVSVCSVTEPPVDAIYVIVKRYVKGKWMYYSERMDNRNWQNVEDCFCVDAGLAYPLTYPVATLNPSAANGTANISSVNLIGGGSGYTAPLIEAIDETGAGTGALFEAVLTAGVITGVNVLDDGGGYIIGQTVLQVTDATGSGAVMQPVITNIVDFIADSAVFTAANVGDVIRIKNNNTHTAPGITTNGAGQATITEYISSTQVRANLTQPITAVVPNDPYRTPIPAISGQWSISTPVTSVHGLNHIEGLQVAILADGSVVNNQTVTGGKITLPHAASNIVIGLPFIAQTQTLYLDVQGIPGGGQGKRKTLNSAIIRVENSRGASVGSNQPDSSTQVNGGNVPWTGLVGIKDRNSHIHAGSAAPLFTGDSYVNIPSDWSTRAQFAAQQTYPLPLNLLAVVLQFNMGDT